MDNRNLNVLAIAGMAVIVGWCLLGSRLTRPADPCPGPGPCPAPAPAPEPTPKPAPKPPRKPWGPQDGSGRSLGAVTVGGPVSPDGVEVQVDFPVSQRTKNVGGKDGSGLCVFTSIGHSARWQSERRLEDFQAKMRAEPGGGYPEKVDRMIEKYGRGAKYVQYEGSDIGVIKEALAAGRMPAVTYAGMDPHYGPSRKVAHMVNAVHGDGQRWAVLDNNYIGEQDLVWMSEQEFRDRYTALGGGWCVVLLTPPPPPPPTR